MATREQMWQSLDNDVDVLVVGGGITGAGIARDAARRGLDVTLVEMRDLAFGTSSRSSKLVHGGLRYLEQYEFSLVFEAVSERRILLDIAPHLVNPLGFIFPVYKDSRRNLLTISAGMWLYDGLSLFRSPKKHRKLKPSDVAALEPALSTERMTGAPLYYDCSTDDARLTLETALDAVEAGASICTYAPVVSFLKDDEGRLCGAVVKDAFSGELREVRARVVINATGPWTDRIRAMSRGRDGQPLLRPTKGTHIVVSRQVLPVDHAVVCFHPDDGRVLFAIPWGDATYLGTTDTDYDGDPAEVYATADDVRYIIEAAAAYFPRNRIEPSDIISTWAGLRPLMRPPSDDDTEGESDVSREHQIVVDNDGMITIAGGKLTTYRLMARQVVDAAEKLLRLSNALPEVMEEPRTESEPLPGGVGWPEDDDHERVADRILAVGDGHFDYDSALLLANTYGMRGLDIAELARDRPALGQRIAGARPEILAQIEWAVTKELCCTITDAMKQRTQLYYRANDQGLGAVDVVGQHMARLLGWDDERLRAEQEAYRDEVAKSRAWRGEWEGSAG